MNVSQSLQGGKGKNKRAWTKEEEEVLIDGLLEMSTDSNWKGDGRFKNGFKNKLEDLLNEKFPGCGPKANPHIESKIKWFKEKYNVIQEMLRTSGFGWDDLNKMITCERQSYEDFCRTHKAAQGLWRVAFPYYDKLGLIFGADRANGNASETFQQAVDNQLNDAIDLGNDESETDNEIEETGSVNQTNEATPGAPPAKKARKEKTPKGKLKKKLSMVDDLTSIGGMGTAFTGFINNMNTHLSTIANAFYTTQQHEQVIMAREQEVEDRKKNLINELINIAGLSRHEAMIAAKKLAADHTNLSLFYESPDDAWKKEFVLDVLHPHLHDHNHA